MAAKDSRAIANKFFDFTNRRITKNLVCGPSAEQILMTESFLLHAWATGRINMPHSKKIQPSAFLVKWVEKLEYGGRRAFSAVLRDDSRHGSTKFALAFVTN